MRRVIQYDFRDPRGTDIIEVLGKLPGKHTVVITATRIHSESEGFVEEAPYEVIARDAKSANVRVYNSTLKRHIESRVELTKDGYWEYSDDPIKNYCEKYKRIK